MPISSRTPEGEPNVCPLCGHHLRLEPSIEPCDGPCPFCGSLLWFAEDGKRRPDSPGSFIIRTGRERLGAFPAKLQVRLIEVVYVLTPSKDLARNRLERLLAEASSWTDFLDLLERRAPPVDLSDPPEEPARRSPSVIRSAGRAILAGVKKLLVGTS